MTRQVLARGAEVTEDGFLRYVELVEDDSQMLVEPVMICDFCASPEPCWSFPARRVQTSQFTHSSDSWAACQACRNLIDRGDRDRLARRAWRASRRLGFGPSLKEIKRVHGAFFAARIDCEVVPL